MKYMLRLGLVVVLIGFATTAMAQVPPPDPSGYGAPIDGFATLLLAAASGYGIKQIRKRNE